MLMLQLYIIVAIACAIIGHTHGRSEYTSRIPNGGSFTDKAGHLSGPGSTLTSFAKDFANQGFKWTVALCRKDSDGDGRSNGEELGDTNCVWTGSSNNNVLRKTGLTNPGRRDATFPSNAPTTKAPTSPPTNVPTTRPTIPSFSPTKLPTKPGETFSPSTRFPSLSPTKRVTPSLSPSANPSAPELNMEGKNQGVQEEEVLDPRQSWIIHSVLMGISFGLLFPVGTLIPICQCLRKKPIWLVLHQYTVVLAAILAIAGFVLAIVVWNKTKLASVTSNRHGNIGIAIMALVVIQVLMGRFRPHLEKPGEKKSLAREIFETIHPWVGRAIVIISLVQVMIGYELLGQYFPEKQDELMLWGQVHGWGLLALWGIVSVALKLSAALAASSRGAHAAAMGKQVADPADSELPPQAEEVIVNDEENNVTLVKV